MQPCEVSRPLHQLQLRPLYTYAIGSRGRAITRLAILLTFWLVALSLLYWVLATFTDWPLFLFLLIVVLTIIHRSLNPNAGGMWAMFIMKDSAYGWVTDSGIEYRTLFRNGKVHWSDIYQLDYSARTGRITVYLRQRTLPVQFGPPSIQQSDMVQVLQSNTRSCGGIFVEKT
jgi:hypothetical protein